MRLFDNAQDDEEPNLDARSEEVYDAFEDAEEGRLIPRQLEEQYREQGYALRMVRVSLAGQTDIKSIFKRRQQGWVFVRPDEINEFMGSAFLGRSAAGIGGLGTEHDLVTNGDLALMKIDLRKQQQLRDRAAVRVKEQSQQADAASTQYIKFHNDSKSEVRTGVLPAEAKNRSASFKD